MKLPLLHDCAIDGQWVRHRMEIDCAEVKLNSGAIRFEGTRCDGTPIHTIGHCAGAAITTDPCTTYDERLMIQGKHMWRSLNYGPWEPLIDFPDQDRLYESDLFGEPA